jgi:hypothetical protein
VNDQIDELLRKFCESDQMNRVGDTLQHTGANEVLVRALVRHGVEFVVVGGLAVSWYCPHREADDMDLMINPTSENSARVSAALVDVRVDGHQYNSFARLGLQVPVKQVYYAEILTPRSEGPTFTEVSSSAVSARLFNIPVLVANPDSLIRMKQLALSGTSVGSEKHLADIECLSDYKRDHAAASK